MTYREHIQTVAYLPLPWNALNHKKILVTGATGLIGGCLADILMTRRNCDYEVFAMGRNHLRLKQMLNKYQEDKRFHIICGDVTIPLNCQEHFDFIIHAASGAAPADFAAQPVETMKSNINGVTNLIEYGIAHGMQRFLFISSGEVYGQGDGRVFTEDYSGYVDCTSPRSCYPSSKRAAETLCVSYAAEYDADIVIARPCHVFGPHFTENDNRVYAQFIRNVLQNEDIVMKSSGEQYRSWCYVVDCASALLHILLKGTSGEAYNIADANAMVTIRELAEMTAMIGGQQIVIKYPNNTEARGYNPVQRSLFSTEKIQSLGWRATGDMFEKLVATIEEQRIFKLI